MQEVDRKIEELKREIKRAEAKVNCQIRLMMSYPDRSVEESLDEAIRDLDKLKDRLDKYEHEMLS